MISGATTFVLLSHYDTTTTATTTGLAVGAAATVSTSVMAVAMCDMEQDMKERKNSVDEVPDTRSGFASSHFGSYQPRAIYLCSPD